MVAQNPDQKSFFDPFTLQEATRSIFSEYLTSIDQYISDLKLIAERDGSAIRKDVYTGCYFLESVPSEARELYVSNGKKAEIEYHSLLVPGFRCLFMGYSGNPENTGNNGGHFYGMAMKASSPNNLYFIFLRRGECLEVSEMQFMNSYRRWNTSKAKYKRGEEIKTAKVAYTEDDIYLDNVYANGSGKFVNPGDSMVTGTILPLTACYGWDKRESFFKAFGYQLTPHSLTTGAAFDASWFVPETYNGKWNVDRMSPLCACIGAAVDNFAAIQPANLSMVSVPRLNPELVTKASLDVGKSIGSLFANPVSVIGGNEVVYSYKKTVDANGWVNLVLKINDLEQNNSPLALFSVPDQQYIEDRDDTAVSMPVLITTNILSAPKYQSSMMMDSTLMVAPDFLLLDASTQELFNELTIADLCYLILKYTTLTEVALVCGVSHATCKYTVSMDDVSRSISSSCAKVEKAIVDKKTFLTGYLSVSAVQKALRIYGAFFAHVLMRRQCGGYISLITHNEILMSKNRIMEEYNKRNIQWSPFMSNMSLGDKKEDIKAPVLTGIPFLKLSDEGEAKDEEEVH